MPSTLIVGFVLVVGAWSLVISRLALEAKRLEQGGKILEGSDDR